MELFETYFEEPVIANENVVNSYAKWWENVFMPNYKKRAEKLKFAAENIQDENEIILLRKQIKEGKEVCNDILDDAWTAGNAIRLYLAWWCGNIIFGALTGGVSTIVLTIIDVITRKPDDTPGQRLQKSASQGLAILNAVEKIVDKKEKELKNLKSKKSLI